MDIVINEHGMKTVKIGCATYWINENSTTLAEVRCNGKETHDKLPIMEDIHVLSEIVLDSGEVYPVTHIGCSFIRGSFDPVGTTLYIPASVKHLSFSFTPDDLFGDLNTIVVDKDNPNFCSVDGVLFSKDMKKLVSYPALAQRDKYVIPDGVEIIGYSAFMKCKTKEIYMSDTVEKIEENAFHYSDIKKIRLSESLETIKEMDFYCCGIREIEFPKSLENVEKGAFDHCEELETVILNSTTVSFWYGSFVDCGDDFEFLLKTPGGETVDLTKYLMQYVEPDSCEEDRGGNWS
jgi:hypothetical protein